MGEEEEVESKAAGMKSFSQPEPPGEILFLVLPLLSTLVAFTGASFSRGLRLYLGSKMREQKWERKEKS